MFDIAGSFGRPIVGPQTARSLTYVDSQAAFQTYEFRVSPRPPKQLTDFKASRIYGFAWSRDGKQLAISAGVMNNDVVLIKDFLP